MGPGVVVLQEKCCLLLWPDSGNSSLQLSQRCYVAVRVGDELIVTLFVSWCDSCAWPSGTWLVFHVAVATDETRHPPPHCANIHCLVSVNVQQASMNVIGDNFFRMEELNYTPFFHTHFHVRRHFVRLPLCCLLSHGNEI